MAFLKPVCELCAEIGARKHRPLHYRWRWTEWQNDPKRHAIPVAGGVPACILDAFTGTIEELADMMMILTIRTRNNLRDITGKSHRLPHEPLDPIELRRHLRTD